MGRKRLGVIGGLGPMATAYFMQMVVEMTEAGTDQEHIEVMVHSCPSVPDRTSYILGLSREDPGEPMARIGQKLAAYGAQILAIPCITAHYFYDKLSEKIPIPIIDSIDETARYLKKKGIRAVGLMATTGTVQSGLFQKSLRAFGIDVLLPGENRQEDVMYLIYRNVKATKPVDMNRFRRISEELWDQGAEVILLGCTELSMVRRDEGIGAGYLDVMQVLAKCSVEQCGRLKPEYEELITGEK